MLSIRRDGRVGLRRQIKVLVRKGVGSNPTLVKLFFIHPVAAGMLVLLFLH
jgi:hypothetical protein